jgi:transposase
VDEFYLYQPIEWLALPLLGKKVQKSLSTRTHKCPYCGYEADRDVNAAINILKRD